MNQLLENNKAMMDTVYLNYGIHNQILLLSRWRWFSWEFEENISLSRIYSANTFQLLT